MTTTALRWGLCSDVGRVRRINQDAAMANGSIFAVADGMGGHRGGEVASDIVAGHLIQQQSVPSVDELSSLVLEANRMIRARAALEPSLSGMGTTVVALAVTSIERGAMQFAAANVGDSRLYRLHDELFEQVTSDHSLVAELTRAGQLTEEEAYRHPQRNVLTRALGVDDAVAVDSWVFPARIGQRFLLCSDGLINEVADLHIESTLRQVVDPKTASEQLVDMANRAGGRDNVTVLVVDVVDASSCEPAETSS